MSIDRESMMGIVVLICLGGVFIWSISNLIISLDYTTRAEKLINQFPTNHKLKKQYKIFMLDDDRIGPSEYEDLTKIAGE